MIVALQLMISADRAGNAQSILNLGFEMTVPGTSNIDPESSRFQPAGWIRTSNNSVLESHIQNVPDFGFPTEGNNFLYLFSSNVSAPRSAGQFIEQSTVVNFSRIETLTFDYYRRAAFVSDLDAFVETNLKVGDVRLWSINSPAELENQKARIDVSMFSGPTTVAFGVEITQDHWAGPAGMIFIDNIELVSVPEPTSRILFLSASLSIAFLRGGGI